MPQRGHHRYHLTSICNTGTESLRIAVRLQSLMTRQSIVVQIDAPKLWQCSASGRHHNCNCGACRIILVHSMTMLVAECRVFLSRWSARGLSLPMADAKPYWPSVCGRGGCGLSLASTLSPRTWVRTHDLQACLGRTALVHCVLQDSRGIRGVLNPTGADIVVKWLERTPTW